MDDFDEESELFEDLEMMEEEEEEREAQPVQPAPTARCRATSGRHQASAPVRAPQRKAAKANPFTIIAFIASILGFLILLGGRGLVSGGCGLVSVALSITGLILKNKLFRGGHVLVVPAMIIGSIDLLAGIAALAG